ncbi:TniQ family protein [Undibacterium terreum]|uniref:TniQ family protein n=1 Tax=Undibacterium terreum TaxID=1224302 RepID=UPI0016676A55|nr:TniQ family protein [Undibacterium terreum]
MNSYRLFGVPKIFPTEAISSWLQRISQQQGVPIARIYELVKIKQSRDTDVDGLSAQISNLIEMAKLNFDEFQVAKIVSKAIRKTPPLQKQVRLEGKKIPITAFCSSCLKHDRVPYYRIEWRFHFWKICPIHLEAMKTECFCCKQRVVLNRSILFSISAVPNLAFCQFCKADLTFSTVGPLQLNARGMEKAVTQQNMMSGILNGYCLISPITKKFSLHIMMRLYQLDLLFAAQRDDFSGNFNYEQRVALLKFLETIQTRTRERERLHERASQRWRGRS